MGDAASSGPSLAALGLTVAGSIIKGRGEKAQADFQADKADRAAEFGKMQAALTDTVMREQLITTLGHIETIRAAGHIDPTSPTTAAILDNEARISDRQRTAKMLSIESQIDEDVAGARYLRESGDYAVLQSYFGAATEVASGVAKGANAWASRKG